MRLRWVGVLQLPYMEAFEKCVDDVDDKVGKNDLVVQGSADIVSPEL